MSPGDLYVGYLSIPKAHRRAMALLLPVLLLGMLASAAAFALKQPAWGDGVWEVEAPKTWTGVLTMAPYPTLFTPATDDPATAGDALDAPGAYLLVGAAKSAPSRASLAAAGFPDLPATVTVTGYDLHQDGRRIIALEVDEATSIAPAGDPPGWWVLGAWSPTAFLPARLRGEILDAKCYLGAMRPGHGRGHKACAITCISGGIPPMLVTRGAGDRLAYHLLVGPDGEALDGDAIDRLLPLVGEPVELVGESATFGNWHLFAVDPGDIRAR